MLSDEFIDKIACQFLDQNREELEKERNEPEYCCPFCGGDELETEEQGMPPNHIWFVQCTECLTEGPLARNERTAIALWDLNPKRTKR